MFKMHCTGVREHIIADLKMVLNMHYPHKTMPADHFFALACRVVEEVRQEKLKEDRMRYAPRVNKTDK